MQRIPRTYWHQEEAQPLLDNLLAYLRKIPVQERTSTTVLDAMQLADSLASLLPLNDAKLIRKELGELGVRVIRIGTVVEQMRYDKERIAVKAGYSGPLSLLLLIPGANLVILILFAFTEWPIERELAALRAGVGGFAPPGPPRGGYPPPPPPGPPMTTG